MLRKIAYLFLILGGSLLIYGILTGEVGFALFLIFPVFYGSGAISALSFIFLFLGFILFFIEPFSFSHSTKKFKSPPVTYPSPMEENVSEEDVKEKIKTKKKYGGIILIGPIPIVFGSDRDTVLVVVLIVLLLLAFLVFFLAMPFLQG